MNEVGPVGVSPTPKYVGFWARFVAFIVDSIVMSLLLIPLGYMLYDSGTIDDLITAYSNLPSDPAAMEEVQMNPWLEFLLNIVFPAVFFLLFWFYKSATPGKMVINAVIVDAETLGKPTKWQLGLRYFGYYVSVILLCLGFLWIAFDSKKRGWHDLMAGTLVIRGEDQQNSGKQA